MTATDATRFVRRIAFRREEKRLNARLDFVIARFEKVSERLFQAIKARRHYDPIAYEHEALAVQMDFLARRLEEVRENAAEFREMELSGPVRFAGIE